MTGGRSIGQATCHFLVVSGRVIAPDIDEGNKSVEQSISAAI
jgi:hypothetical protein